MAPFCCHLEYNFITLLIHHSSLAYIKTTVDDWNIDSEIDCFFCFDVLLGLVFTDLGATEIALLSLFSNIQ